MPSVVFRDKFAFPQKVNSLTIHLENDKQINFSLLSQVPIALPPRHPDALTNLFWSTSASTFSRENASIRKQKRSQISMCNEKENTMEILI